MISSPYVVDVLDMGPATATSILIKRNRDWLEEHVGRYGDDWTRAPMIRHQRYYFTNRNAAILFKLACGGE